MFAVKNDSKLFEDFKAKFNNGQFQRDDLNIKMIIDPLPTFTIEGKPDLTDGTWHTRVFSNGSYSQVCMIITPQIVNTSMLGRALSHQEIFNKYFEEHDVEIATSKEIDGPFILIMGNEVAATPVRHISTFGDELSILKNIGRPVGKYRVLLDLIVKNRYNIIRSCALDPAHLRIGKAILDILKVATLEHKANGVTPSISDMIISGHFYSLLECLPEEARTFFIKLICHTYVALNYTTNDARREEYARFIITTIVDFKFPDYNGKDGLVE